MLLFEDLVNGDGQGGIDLDKEIKMYKLEKNWIQTVNVNDVQNVDDVYDDLLKEQQKEMEEENLMII
ncbi:MAG: hypothetical protein EZS28_020919 [Streblomastix strix]|uniref:Uncharacterized protein n=1 Tax=Streblomastix strix TaxID=222440 RepID=A0A5J4VM82_9EUKA|nr:MAG: hypothetical protein EZS28_020919 [Streblomastix strix]